MKTKTFTNAPKFAALQEFAVIVQTGTLGEIYEGFFKLCDSPLFTGKGWQHNFNKLGQMLETFQLRYTVFAKGNSKLPFYSFSSLPGVTCPGAGDCIDWCYSFRAWRYPAAFARQVQNTFLLRFNKQAITSELALIAQTGDNVTLRLYVDGDFSSGGDVAYWFQTLQNMPTIKAYGYSKSFSEILTYADSNPLPSNYLLNISGGHCHDEQTKQKIQALSITRGVFVAVNIGKKVKASDYGTKETNSAIRQVINSKVFPCPGKCGECTSVGHACGSDVFRGKVIAIAIH